MVVSRVILQAKFEIWLGCIIYSVNNQIGQPMLLTYYIKSSIFVTILRMWIIKAMVERIYLIILQIQKQFLAFIIIKVIVIIFHKVTYNAGLAFNLTATDIFESFHYEMLAFLFVMVYYDIKKY